MSTLKVLYALSFKLDYAIHLAGDAPCADIVHIPCDRASYQNLKNLVPGLDKAVYYNENGKLKIWDKVLPLLTLAGIFHIVRHETQPQNPPVSLVIWTHNEFIESLNNKTLNVDTKPYDVAVLHNVSDSVGVGSSASASKATSLISELEVLNASSVVVYPNIAEQKSSHHKSALEKKLNRIADEITGTPRPKVYFQAEDIDWSKRIFAKRDSSSGAMHAFEATKSNISKTKLKQGASSRYAYYYQEYNDMIQVLGELRVWISLHKTYGIDVHHLVLTKPSPNNQLETMVIDLDGKGATLVPLSRIQAQWDANGHSASGIGMTEWPGNTVSGHRALQSLKLYCEKTVREMSRMETASNPTHTMRHLVRMDISLFPNDDGVLNYYVNEVTTLRAGTLFLGMYGDDLDELEDKMNGFAGKWLTSMKEVKEKHHKNLKLRVGRMGTATASGSVLRLDDLSG